MSISVGGTVVTEGLVVHYDALNYESYPGSGVSWYDLTPYSNNGSLDNGTNNVTIANGYASFTDTPSDRYVDTSIGEIDQDTQYTTVDMWAKFKGPTAPNPVDNGYIFGWHTNYYGTKIRFENGTPTRFGFTTQINDVYGLDEAQAAALDLLNNWKHYSFVFCTGSIAQSNQKMYINGALQTLSDQNPSLGDYPQARRFSNNTISAITRFPGSRATNGDLALLNMDVSLIKIYNRELTQAEVTQNFNAHKGRFNIY
jgi:hypothetical protein